MHRGGIVFLISIALLAATPLSAQPTPGSWIINCGLWRTDSGFTSTIQLKNRLATGPIAVTPILYMADGTEYDLPAVTILASSVATVNVNNALNNIPTAEAANLSAHLSQYGSAALLFTGASSALIAQTSLGSPVLSLSYSARFTGVMAGTPAQQTLEGLWWARDGGIGGFVSLSNATSTPKNLSVQWISSDGQTHPSQSLTLSPHANQMLDLVTLIGRQLKAGEAGGLRIQFTGLAGEVNVTGGLENRQEGYSARIPFWMPPIASAAAPASSQFTLGHAGIMVGAPDAMMGFPIGTRFSPYLALRNVTAQAIPVSLTLYTEQGKALQGPVQSLKPFESRQVDMANVLHGLGLKDLNGTFTLAVGHAGQATDVMTAVGSADAGGTYVFEIEGRAAEQTFSKQSPYWSVKDGTDTMVAVWNPTGAPEDVILTLNFAGGSGHYRFPVHLAAYATANLDLKELIADQSPDDEGNLMPANVQEGSFVFHSPTDLPSPVSLNVNVGVFNVAKGTCYYGEVYCDGYTGSLTVSPSPISLATGTSQQLSAFGAYSSGPVAVYASWSCSNPSVASAVGGLVTAMGAGSATIIASASLPVYGVYAGYNPSCATLQPYRTFTGQAQATVKCAFPTSETTQFYQWGDNDKNAGNSPAIAEFIQTLQPTSSYSGFVVTEGNASPATDSCWFNGAIQSPGPPVQYASPTTGVTGSSWPVAGGRWGPDYVGMGYYLFGTYQSSLPKRALPACSITMFQTLAASCPGGGSQAFDGTVVLNIIVTGGGISVTREGVNAARALVAH